MKHRTCPSISPDPGLGTVVTVAVAITYDGGDCSGWSLRCPLSEHVFQRRKNVPSNDNMPRPQQTRYDIPYPAELVVVARKLP